MSAVILEEFVPTTADIRNQVEVKDVVEQPALVIRDRALLEKLPEVMPAAIDEVHGHMHTVGATFAGPALRRLPVSGRRGDGRSRDRLARGRALRRRGPGRVHDPPRVHVLSYMHRGPYKELGRSYRAIETFMEREGLVGTGAPREIHETSPEEVPDPADWLTELRFPIVRDDAYGLRH